MSKHDQLKSINLPKLDKSEVENLFVDACQPLDSNNPQVKACILKLARYMAKKRDKETLKNLHLPKLDERKSDAFAQIRKIRNINYER